jgi:hypothetical protein
MKKLFIISILFLSVCCAALTIAPVCDVDKFPASGNTIIPVAPAVGADPLASLTADGDIIDMTAHPDSMVEVDIFTAGVSYFFVCSDTSGVYNGGILGEDLATCTNLSDEISIAPNETHLVYVDNCGGRFLVFK